VPFQVNTFLINTATIEKPKEKYICKYPGTQERIDAFIGYTLLKRSLKGVLNPSNEDVLKLNGFTKKLKDFEMSAEYFVVSDKGIISKNEVEESEKRTNNKKLAGSAFTGVTNQRTIESQTAMAVLARNGILRELKIGAWIKTPAMRARIIKKTAS